MKIFILAAALLVPITLANAQPRANRNQNNGQNANGGGAFPLPKGVKRVISVDALNTLLVESEDEDGNKGVSAIPVRHIYSGGLALLFGGFSIPTQIFVAPAQAGGGFNGGGNQNGGFNGGQFNQQNGGGNQGFGGNQAFGGNQGLNNAANGGFLGR